MASRIPAIKKTVSSYLSDETGRVTRHSVLSLGAILASAALLSTRLKEVSAQTQHQHSHLSAPPPPPPHHSHASY